MPSVFTRKRVLAGLAILWLAGTLVYGLLAWLFPRDPVLGRWYPWDPFEIRVLEFRPGGKLLRSDASDGTWKPVTAYVVSPESLVDTLSSTTFYRFFSEAEVEQQAWTSSVITRCQRAYAVEMDGKTEIWALTRDRRTLTCDHSQWGRQDSLPRWLKKAFFEYWVKGRPAPGRDCIGKEYFTRPPEPTF